MAGRVARRPASLMVEARLSSRASDSPAVPARLWHFGKTAVGRRHALLGVLGGSLAFTAHPCRADPQPGASELQPLSAFWAELQAYAQRSLGDDFTAALVFYQPDAELPSGTPGDPSRDFSRGADVCGQFQPGDQRPYSMCPAQPGSSADTAATGCCRHFAFCVPYSRFAFADIDRVSTVVASPRMAALAPNSWKAMLMHEMGHAVDFYVFGSRYGLYDHKRDLSTGVATLLKPVDREKDPEIRADDLANALLVPSVGEKVCYAPDTTLQILTAPGQECTGTLSDSSSDGPPLAHFPHPPARG